MRFFLIIVFFLLIIKLSLEKKLLLHLRPKKGKEELLFSFS